MAKTKAELQKDAQALGIATDGLTVKQLKAAIKAVEDKDVDFSEVDATPGNDQETDQAQALEDENKAAVERPTFTHNGHKWAFKADCPQTLNMDGESLPISELIKDRAAMTELIEGKNNFVKIVQ